MKSKKIFLTYIIAGVIWVFISDAIVNYYIPPEYFLIFQKIKGMTYVIVTGWILYIVVRKIEDLNNSKEHQEKLSTLINSMVDFVNFKDGEGRWLEANQFGLKLFQLENVDYRGKKDSELAKYTDFYHDALLYCEQSDEQAWSNGAITRCEETIPLPNGSYKYFDTIKVPLFYEDGRRKGLVVIGRDITDKKIAEEQLLKSEKLSVVGELAASVGHEIRNPLTSIKGFVQLLEEKDSENQLYYDIMSKELNRIDHIVGELLLLAKPQKVHFSMFNLNTIVKDIVNLLETQANLTNVIIHFEPNEELFLECEQNQLKQLMINIVKNAIEASNSKDNVWVSLKKINDNEIRICVEDEGVGIPDNFLKRIGEPFYSSKEKGTGLGLTVSHKIVALHGGTINYYRREPKGTRVEMILPLIRKANK